ncbi:MAG: cation-translocating P-type ATPase [Candidatus Limnocylindrales bacterium]
MTTEEGSRPGNAPTGSAGGEAKAWHAMSGDAVLAELKVTVDAGLSGSEAAARLGTYGSNKFTDAPPEPRWQAFLRQYQDPMQIVLLIAGVISLFLPGQFATGVLLIVLTLLNAAMGLNQEGKAEASVSALQKLMVVKAKVRRDGQLAELAMADLVPGDVVNIEAGDLVPADARILTAATLEIDESALTGESVPVPKQVDAVAADAALGDRVDLAFMNTQVTRGAGTIVVIGTGMSTEVGHISGMLQASKLEETPLTKQLDKLTTQILAIAGVALLLSISIGLARGNSFQILFLTAVAFSVSAIPTGLPAVVTAVLSAGTTTLANAGAIVKRLRSVETLGSTSAINSDKTGTLTLNQMTAVQMTLVGRRYAISGEGYKTVGQITHTGGQPDVPLEQYLLPMALCADAEVMDGSLVGDPTEGALVVLAAKGGVDPTLTREQYPRVATLPFDAAYKMMATFHRMKDDTGRDVIRGYIKGAPDQLLARAASAHGPDGTEVPAAQLHDAYMAENERLGSAGLRVMATGRKDFDPATFDPNADLLPALDGLTLLAMVGIVDPARPEAKLAIAEAKSAGIRVRMITGDHAVTAGAIAGQLGIEGRAISGAEFAAMSDAEAIAQIDDIGVIARVAPEDKVHLVDILKAKGHIVAMTGDGVNDAPALKRADIGVAMGITGTEVSKEAAVMILTDDNFATIVRAVKVGRALYDNLMRYVRFQMAVLFGFIATFLGSSIFNILGGIPFLPLQTLWVNFTVDVFQAIGLGWGKPREGLMEVPPRPKEQPILPRRLLTWLVFNGLVMAVGTLGVIVWSTYVFGEYVAHSMGLTTFSIFNLFFSLETADEERSMFSSELLENPMLLKTTIVSIAAIIAATELGLLRRLLDTVSLSLDQWAVCTAVAASIVVVCEVKKLLHIRVTEEVAVTPSSPAAPSAPTEERKAA